VLDWVSHRPDLQLVPWSPVRVGLGLWNSIPATVAVESAMLVGVAWALWHIPLMGTEFRWNNVPAFLLSVFAGSVVAAWLFNSAKESVLLCMLFHASVNAVTSGYVFPLFGDADLTRLWWIYALVWVAGAAAIAWRSGPALRSGARS